MRIYIETSVPNFLFNEDVPDERLHTERFFAEVAEGWGLPSVVICTPKEVSTP